MIMVPHLDMEIMQNGKVGPEVLISGNLVEHFIIYVYLFLAFLWCPENGVCTTTKNYQWYNRTEAETMHHKQNKNIYFPWSRVSAFSLSYKLVSGQCNFILVISLKQEPLILEEWCFDNGFIYHHYCKKNDLQLSHLRKSTQ